jgi:mannan endo-1,4-beta-mannosidase
VFGAFRQVFYPKMNHVSNLNRFSIRLLTTSLDSLLDTFKQMNKLFWLWMMMAALTACGGDDEEPQIPPVYVSSDPVNGAVDVSITSTVSVIYDEVVTLAPQHGITVNGSAATVSALMTKLTFQIALEDGKQYDVHIPAGAVINTKNVKSQADVDFSFTTKAKVVVSIKTSLAMANSSAQAVKVYNFLRDNYGVKAISGAMANVSWNINEALWVNQHTGKYPAIATFDYIHLPYSPANWIDYSKTSVIEDWWSNNGLVSASWHWLVPPAEGVTDITKFTYKPEETTFSAANAVIEGTWENTFVKADLAKMAGYLKLLRDKNIPVIWRPLHEAAGNTYEFNGGTAWFWWGTKGATAYKNLWAYMFNYFKAEGLNNLIWVWTTQTKDNPYFPGEAYVDIVGRDIYNTTSATDIQAQFESIQTTYPTLMVTLSEFGNVASFSSQWSAGAKWSFFMPWYDYDRTNSTTSTAFASTDHVHANAAWWKSTMALDEVITRDEMPSLK